MEDLELKEIGQYYGTTQYWDVMGVNVTDGIKYVMDNGYSWLVTDASVILKMVLAKERFVVIKSKLEEDGTVNVKYFNGDGEELYRQDYEWSDAKAEIKFYYTNNVLMLPGEY